MAAVFTGFTQLNKLYVWFIFETWVYTHSHKSLESLKHLRLGWERISSEKLSRIAENFKTCLNLFIRTKGDHFENVSIYRWKRLYELVSYTMYLKSVNFQIASSKMQLDISDTDSRFC